MAWVRACPPTGAALDRGLALRGEAVRGPPCARGSRVLPSGARGAACRGAAPASRRVPARAGRSCFSRGAFSWRGGFGAHGSVLRSRARLGLRCRGGTALMPARVRHLGDHGVGVDALVAEEAGEGAAPVGECREEQLAPRAVPRRRRQPRGGAGRATRVARPRPGARRSARARASARSRARWRVPRGRCRRHRAMTGPGRSSAAGRGGGARSR